jgi:hypothetical protein
MEAVFTESAPKDRFSFTNTGSCNLGPVTVTLSLEDSVGGLIFDTTGDGAGVEVFQPFETVSGAQAVSSVTPVTDGDTSVSLTLTGLAPAQTVAFTIDVDDTLRYSALGQIQIADSEIAGAIVILETPSGKRFGVFDNTSRAQITGTECSS